MRNAAISDRRRHDRPGTGPFFAGMIDAIPVAVTFLFLFLGFGATAAKTGLDIGQSVVMSVVVFAGPAQFVMLDLIQQHAWAAATISALIVNFRFLLMSAALLPPLSAVGKRRVLPAMAGLSASTFLITYSWTKQAERDPAQTFHYFLGVCAAALPISYAATALGFVLVERLPQPLGAMLQLVMPIYFTTLLAKTWRRWRLLVAGIGGLIVTPILNQAAPGFGLVLAGVAIGAIMVATDRRKGRRPGKREVG